MIKRETFFAQSVWLLHLKRDFDDIVCLEGGKEDVADPESHEEAERDPPRTDWAAELSVAEEGQVPPEHEDRDGRDGADGEEGDAEAQCGVLHFESGALKRHMW